MVRKNVHAELNRMKGVRADPLYFPSDITASIKALAESFTAALKSAIRAGEAGKAARGNTALYKTGGLENSLRVASQKYSAQTTGDGVKLSKNTLIIFEKLVNAKLSETDTIERAVEKAIEALFEGDLTWIK